jgi:hypothetical protein
MLKSPLGRRRGSDEKDSVYRKLGPGQNRPDVAFTKLEDLPKPNLITSAANTPFRHSRIKSLLVYNVSQHAAGQTGTSDCTPRSD